MADDKLQAWIAVEGPAKDEAQDMDGGLNVPAPGRGRQEGRYLWGKISRVGSRDDRLWRLCRMEVKRD